MLREVEWSEDRAYRTGSDNEPIQFYMDSLCNSSRIDLLLGYFSSAAINVLSPGFATFLFSGGTIRIVINNVLSQQDKDAIKTGKEGLIKNDLLDLNDIKNLKRVLSDYGRHFFECLSWLIANKKIEINIIAPKHGKGISHYKSGVFHDSVDSVGFKASCNFTAFGLLDNLEELDCFLSWENGRSNKMISRQDRDFEKIFSGQADFVDYLNVEQVTVAIKNEFGDKTINELIIQEKELIQKKSRVLENKEFRKTYEKVIMRIEQLIKEPKFPYSQGPRDYQIQAYENWVNNHFHGIFAMATGTGKTITSLNCALNEFRKTSIYKIVILVPTIVLVEQWFKEVKAFNFRTIIKVSSKSPNWKSELDDLRAAEIFGGSSSFVVISTYKTFTSNKFQEFVNQLNNDTILIADEAHNMASQSVKDCLANLKIKKRIGLSATPKRVYDPIGSTQMESFFNDVEPYTFSFPMEKAIEERILVQYYYFPTIVELNEEEMVEYNEITLQLVKYFQKAGTDKTAQKQYEMLLIKRKAIIHKAKKKLEAFKQIVKEISQIDKSLKYTLVYAPEGFYGDSENLEESFPEIETDSRIIDYYSNIIRTISPGTTVTQFTSNTDEKDHILKSFEKGTIDVLLSMKCLDEGVDIPRTEKAIFCSSTGNPRQFIQRRGRILRKHPEKQFAKIYDLIVIPKLNTHSPGFDIERNLVKKELERVVHFSYLAINKYESVQNLSEVCNYYNLNLDTLYEELK